MISKLMNQELSYGEPEYSKTSAEIGQLRQKLLEQLSPEGQTLLDQLIDTAFRRESALAEAVFVEGFCTAIGMTLETYRHLSQSK